MKLVTYQSLGTDLLRTGLLIQKDEVLDIAAECAARNSNAAVATMLDIIEGGEATRELLNDIAASPKTPGILLNKALLKAPIPRTRKNVFCVGWNYLEHFNEGGKSMQDDRKMLECPVFFSKAPTAITGPRTHRRAVSTAVDGGHAALKGLGLGSSEDGLVDRDHRRIDPRDPVVDMTRWPPHPATSRTT